MKIIKIETRASSHCWDCNMRFLNDFKKPRGSYVYMIVYVFEHFLYAISVKKMFKEVTYIYIS